MPYIKKEQREKYKHIVSEIERLSGGIEFKGDLEYLIFKLMKKFMFSRSYTYTALHDCTYAAQHCADEFRRRFLDKREDKARKENGDIK